MELSFCFLTFMHLVSSFLLCHYAFAHFNSSMYPLCHDDERSALLKFKESLVINHTASGDPSAYPKVASWNHIEENSDCCSWDGVKCNKVTGHVVVLDLASSYLYGSINSSSSLFHLVHLERLDLSDNHFNSSKIPSEIINLSKLTHLNLSLSVFSGQIPAELLELSKLEVLGLNYVDISSTVPHTLANLSSLRLISLCGCSMQGEFPAEIFQLPNLQFLDVKKNPNLTGYLPEFQKNSLLEDLTLSFTRFSGKIPDSIENLKSLTHLDIRSSSFSGKIPPSLGNLTKLAHLYLSGNGFFRELPVSIVKLASLEALEIFSWNFSGEVPTSVRNLTQLSSLTISGCNLVGLNTSSLSWLANLNQLTYLDFSQNNLIGEIPSAVSNLTQLVVLDLSQNQLTGSVPLSLIHQNKLSILVLYSNQLSGRIPVEIGNLTQLNHLSFASNQLEGSVPSSIFELRNLEKLDLSSNNLSGTMDLNTFLINLKSLEALALSSNKFSLLTKTTVDTHFQKFFVLGLRSCNLSKFPHFLHNQDQLKSLDLSSNKIAGQVPGWFLNTNPDGFEYLNLSHNLLTGFEQNLFVLPWATMSTLDLSFNKLLGPLPIPPVSTDSYLVSNNQLMGEIPSQICSLNGLHALDLSYNNLSGILPKCLGNFSIRLSLLKLQANNFHGIIPQTFMNGTNLRMIDFSSNSLQGRVPKSLANCVGLKFLNLGDNQITDIFPSWLGNLQELEVLVLKANNFHGVVEEPKANFEFPKLRIIDLSHNRFTGNLPSKYFECWNAMKDINASKLIYMHEVLAPKSYPIFTYIGFSDYSIQMSNKGTELEYEKLSNLVTAIILSNNIFAGEIPTSIANLKGLRNLNLSKNNLEGHIPPSLGNLKVIESLDLSWNKLLGNIPQQLGELTTLEVFDVSHNQLTGPIPKGKQFHTFDNGCFDGNPGLCGEPLTIKCDQYEPSPKEDRHSESLFAFGWKIVLIGYACGTIIGVLLEHIFSTRNHEWLAKTFPLKLKANGRKRRQRQRM